MGASCTVATTYINVQAENYVYVMFIFYECMQLLQDQYAELGDKLKQENL